MIAASQPIEGSMDLQPIDDDPIYLETIGGQKKQRVYDIDSKGVAFCSSSRASSSSVTVAVDEAVDIGSKFDIGSKYDIGSSRVYDIGSKGVAFCSSSRASSFSVTATVDEAVEQQVMETNEHIAVMET